METDNRNTAYYQTVFETIYIKKLVSNINVCAPDWGETDCVYTYNKFYYFLDGEGKIVIDGDTFLPAPEQLFLIPAGVRHTYSHNPERPVYKCWCHFDLSFREKLALRYNRDTLYVTLPREEIVPLFETLCRARANAGPSAILEEQAVLLKLFGLFLSRTEIERLLPVQNDDFTKTMNSCLTCRLADPVTLDELAGLVHLHPNYFIRVFKKHFGMPPLEYLNILRLEHAAELLAARPDLTIEAVAAGSGFQDYRYFGRMFKKRYGMSPSSYRKTGAD